MKEKDEDSNNESYKWDDESENPFDLDEVKPVNKRGQIVTQSEDYPSPTKRSILEFTDIEVIDERWDKTASLLQNVERLIDEMLIKEAESMVL